MIRFITSAFVIGAALVSAMPASAQEDMTIKVSYADLNVGAPAGAAIFARRIEAAVTEICGDSDARDLSRAALVDACRRTVGDPAREQMRKTIAAAQQNTMLASADTVVLASR